MFFTIEINLRCIKLTGNSTDLVSFEHTPLSNSTHMLGLQWSAQSRDCAQLMTSVNLRIYEDASDSMLRSYSVPSECIGNAYQNSFSASFSSLEKENNICSSIDWEPLDICRKYKLEIEPEYLSSFRGKSSSLEIFTSGTGKQKDKKKSFSTVIQTYKCMIFFLFNIYRPIELLLHGYFFIWRFKFPQ
jgi:hypothetical protein